MSKWFKRGQYSEFKRKLICFPYAGGNAQIYDGWQDQLVKFGIEVIAVQYPGRMERLTEPCINNAPELVSAIIAEFKAQGICSEHLMAYGHSNGALAAFEFAKQLEQNSNTQLQQLFLAARNVPDSSSKSRSTMSDDDLKLELKALNGTPQALLDNQEFLDLVLPIFRADFAIGETYQIKPSTLLTSPCCFIYGADEDLSEDDATNWQQYFKQPLNCFSTEGEHLFINSHKQQLLTLISGVIDGSRKNKLEQTTLSSSYKPPMSTSAQRAEALE